MKKHRPVRRPSRTVPGTKEEILSYLDTHGTEDKDRTAAVAAQYRALRRKQAQEVRLTLDLHGLTSIEAEQRILSVFDSCSPQTREILLIHGRGRHSNSEGGPVLKTLVYQLLEGKLKNRIGRFRPAMLAEGGEGATVVFMK